MNHVQNRFKGSRVSVGGQSVCVLLRYLMFIMVLVTVVVLNCVVVLNLHFRTPSTHVMTDWTKRVTGKLQQNFFLEQVTVNLMYFVLRSSFSWSGCPGFCGCPVPRTMSPHATAPCHGGPVLWDTLQVRRSITASSPAASWCSRSSRRGMGFPNGPRTPQVPGFCFRPSNLKIRGVDSTCRETPPVGILTWDWSSFCDCVQWWSRRTKVTWQISCTERSNRPWTAPTTSSNTCTTRTTTMRWGGRTLKIKRWADVENKTCPLLSQEKDNWSGIARTVDRLCLFLITPVMTLGTIIIFLMGLCNNPPYLPFKGDPYNYKDDNPRLLSNWRIYQFWFY